MLKLPTGVTAPPTGSGAILPNPGDGSILSGQADYAGCERNSVTSRPYGAWGGSFRIEPAQPGR